MFSQLREKFLLETVVFVSGALVMVYEIVGSRILAPFIGTSTYVWTSLIGVILASLSLGYWLGGSTADKKPDLRVLAGVLFLAAALLSTTILLHNFVLAAIASAPFGLEIKSILAALILFAPASVLFGFVTPYAVRLKMLSVETAGKTVGRLYALSTVGSIAGTFLAGFFLLPFVGSLRTLYLIAAILLVLSVALAPFALTQRNIAAILLFLSSIGANEFYNFALLKTVGQRDFDTEYSRVIVFNAPDKKTGKPITALSTDAFSVQSGMFHDSDELVFDYTRHYHLVRHFKPDFREVLMIGGAGYSFPKDFLRKYPNANIEVVEIDPSMTALARRFFRLEDNPRLKIFHEDGRVFLNRAESGKYDAVLLDAFGSFYSIPFQLTTVEAVRKINDSLKPGGIVILNMITAETGEGSLFFQAEYQTYAAVFPHVFFFKVKPDEPAGKSQNLILVACKTVCEERETADAEIAEMLKNVREKPLELTAPILTDDLAPVEFYTSLAQKAAK